ncbi:hypothetical protein AAFX24_28060 [Vibrio mediterranei]
MEQTINSVLWKRYILARASTQKVVDLKEHKIKKNERRKLEEQVKKQA